VSVSFIVVRKSVAKPSLLAHWNGGAMVMAGSRWRRLGRRPSPETLLHLHHESAKRNGELVPAKQGPVISKPSDGIGWAFEYRPVGGLTDALRLASLRFVSHPCRM
jgi:hypothetical protein